MKLFSLLKRKLSTLHIPEPRSAPDPQPSSQSAIAGTSLAPGGFVSRMGYLWIRCSMLVLVSYFGCLGLSLAAEVATGTVAPKWKIGRTMIEWRTVPQPQGGKPANLPFVKMSLRNEGGGGTAPVQIYGRWSGANLTAQNPVLLGLFTKEVALTQTAIIDVALTPLAYKAGTAGKIVLELIVTTGGRESDRRMIPWN